MLTAHRAKAELSECVYQLHLTPRASIRNPLGGFFSGQVILKWLPLVGLGQK